MKKITTIAEYDDFVRKLVPQYPVADETRRLELLAFGMLEEAGEVAGKLKRMYREGESNNIEIAKELGDILGYLTALSQEIGFDLEDIININVEKITKRIKTKTLLGTGDNR